MSVWRLWLVLTCSAVLALAQDQPTVGREGRLEITLPTGNLQAKPLSGRPVLILRIAERVAVDGGVRYDLRFQGAVPGTYDLADYLVAADGSRPSGLPTLPVTVRSLLPADHKGSLVETPGGEGVALGGYRLVMVAIIVAWVVLLPLLVRRRRRSGIPPPIPAPPSLAERLAPLVAQAQTGTLDSVGLAQLERLLIATWRERLDLGGIDYRSALQRLRDDATAGALLRQVERWLHARPDGSAPVDVGALLAPYRGLPGEVTP